MPNKIPISILSKIERQKPSYSIGNDYASSYKSVIIYVQNGLAAEVELFKTIAKAIFTIQKSGSRKYPLLVFGFGDTEYLQHESKYFDFGYVNDSSNINKVAETISRISGTGIVRRAVIPVLFPKTDVRSLYHGKINVENDDMLIVIGSKDEVFFLCGLKNRIKSNIKKHILLVEIGNENIKYIFKPQELKFIKPTAIKQNNMEIRRYFSDDNLKRIKKDFKFLIRLIDTSFGEFDFAIRDNYFNIYYKGNSIAKVEPKKYDLYKVSINAKFFKDTKANNPVFYKTIKGSNNIILCRKHLHPFFQRKHLNEFASKIKSVHNGEEIDFEQSLITDNINRSDFIFIDRQVSDTKLNRKRLDLLALKQVEENKYKFVVSEVKLGNNTELKNKVASQLDYYVKHINDNFEDYKRCYEKQFEQKRELGLIKSPVFDKIIIIEPAEGIILVGGYSGIAKKHIDELKTTFSHLKVKQFTNEI